MAHLAIITYTSQHSSAQTRPTPGMSTVTMSVPSPLDHLQGSTQGGQRRMRLPNAALLVPARKGAQLRLYPPHQKRSVYEGTVLRWRPISLPSELMNSAVFMSDAWLPAALAAAGAQAAAPVSQPSCRAAAHFASPLQPASTDWCLEAPTLVVTLGDGQHHVDAGILCGLVDGLQVVCANDGGVHGVQLLNPVVGLHVTCWSTSSTRDILAQSPPRTPAT